ncbi:probable cyclin-dependent serine/threonine-protein kinase DDB_G0292550 [Microplitis mediator]|uniref:probable cyclin-dependent serine/threonine-protein kinase DDB_G0292550 n=1 Tax=Microplitis mediator TaxID=375433 RepID=UPI0025550B63|nr:probable cyclin-dependent serine/threonine-protein kinase DDB_G0292550 [Microplitis mediator]
MKLKISICILLTCTPIAICLAQKKMVVIVPRQVRRAAGSPWRQFSRHPQFVDNEILQSASTRGHPNPTAYLQPPYNFINTKTPFRLNKDVIPPPSPPPLLQQQQQQQQQYNSVDDNLNNHEQVNHILVPHGKRITHGISFGKGYIPHESLMYHQTNSFLSPQDNHSAQSATQLTTQNHNEYFHNNNNNNNNNHDDSMNEKTINEIQSLILKAKQLGLLANDDYYYGNNEKSSIKRGTDESILNNNKGFVIHDTLVFDDYNKKITELAKNWPRHLTSSGFNLNNNNYDNSYKNLGRINVAELSQHLTGHNINFDNYESINSYINHSPSGYAVKEQVEDIPQDNTHRYKPIVQTPPNQSPVATAAAIIATGAQVVPHIEHENSNLTPGYFSLHSPSTIYNK